jgi:hypothetical protein
LTGPLQSFVQPPLLALILVLIFISSHRGFDAIHFGATGAGACFDIRFDPHCASPLHSGDTHLPPGPALIFVLIFMPSSLLCDLDAADFVAPGGWTRLDLRLDLHFVSPWTGPSHALAQPLLPALTFVLIFMFCLSSRQIYQHGGRNCVDHAHRRIGAQLVDNSGTPRCLP